MQSVLVDGGRFAWSVYSLPVENVSCSVIWDAISGDPDIPAFTYTKKLATMTQGQIGQFIADAGQARAAQVSTVMTLHAENVAIERLATAALRSAGFTILE